MALKAGWEDAGNNLVRNTATGQMLDQNHPLYLQAPDGPAPSASPSSGVSAPGGVQSVQDVPTASATVGHTAQNGQPTTVAQSFQQALINRLNPQAVSAQSASVAPAITANKLAEQRGAERQRALIANRNAAAGVNNSGGADARFLGIEQDRAAREGQFAGAAVQHANDLENQNLTSALGLTGSLMAGNANLQQQKQLADLDAQLRREGIGAQTQLGQGDLALRSRLGEGQLNLGLLSALMGNELGRGQLSLGGAQLDQAGLLGLLGGL